MVLSFFYSVFSWEVFCGLKAVPTGPTWCGSSVALSCVLFKNCLSSLFILGWFLFLLKDLCNTFGGET